MVELAQMLELRRLRRRLFADAFLLRTLHLSSTSALLWAGRIYT